MIADQIKQKILSAIPETSLSLADIHVSHPENAQFGDFTTNIALRLTKDLRKPPMEIAETIASQIEKGDLIEKVEAVKPGFINIHLATKTLLNEVTAIQKSKSTYGQAEPTGKKIIMEFGQPNTHKLPHIGHLFSYIYGESMARILEYQGHTVIRANYQGDIGLHVAKCLWQVLKDDQNIIPRNGTLSEKAKYLQECYQSGATAYEESEQLKQEIDELNKKIYNQDQSIVAIWKETRQWSLDFYTDLEKRLGITYDRKYFETESAPLGKKTVVENIGKVFEEDNGAVIFRGENYGQHTRVFLNKYGNPTYEGKDTGLIQLKKKDFDFDLSMTSTAVEQKNYWDTVNTACELLFPELKGKLKHIDFGMINLSSGKMSSRTGNIIDAVGLIEIVKTGIKENYPEQPDDVAEEVALTSIKYSFLKGEVYKNKAFDIETSISKEGDSGPYLLYSVVRCNSILSKESAPEEITIDESLLSDEELSIIRLLYKFPETVELAAASCSQHHITSYLFNLAQTFNLFYQKQTILKAELEQKKFRLILTFATSKILKNGLALLGIKTVEKM